MGSAGERFHEENAVVEGLNLRVGFVRITGFFFLGRTFDFVFLLVQRLLLQGPIGYHSNR